MSIGSRVSDRFVPVSTAAHPSAEKKLDRRGMRTVYGTEYADNTNGERYKRSVERHFDPFPQCPAYLRCKMRRLPGCGVAAMGTYVCERIVLLTLLLLAKQN